MLFVIRFLSLIKNLCLHIQIKNFRDFKMFSYQLVIATIVIAEIILNATGCSCGFQSNEEGYCESSWSLFSNLLSHVRGFFFI